MKISIITPTYNRGYLLGQCYNSLIAQTDKDFEWIVVDDGSTDGTEDIINKYILEERISIKYIKQVNGGKHRAHNAGVLGSSGELCVCLDSDDALAENAIETAKQYWTLNAKDNHIGILALRGDFEQHQPICSRIPQGLKSATISVLRDKFKFSGDTVLFFRSSLLKQHLFREFSGENFLTESNLYDELEEYGEMLLLDRVLYYCEYLSDGLTAKYKKLLIDNPKGTCDTYYRMSIRSVSFWLSLKYAIISLSYLTLVEDRSELANIKYNPTMLLAKFFVPFLKYRYIK